MKVKEYSGDYSADPTTYQVDCTAAKRAEITWTSHARAGMPAPPKMLVILNGHDFYSKTLNFSLKKHEKPWYRGTFPELESDEFRKTDGTPFPTQVFPIGNCDQASLLGWCIKDVGKLAKPGRHTCTIKTTEAISRAKGYAREFYLRLKELGGETTDLTVWLSKDLLPTRYKIAVGRDLKVQDAHWDVSFERWHMAPITLPAASEIR